MRPRGPRRRRPLAPSTVYAEAPQGRRVAAHEGDGRQAAGARQDAVRVPSGGGAPPPRQAGAVPGGSRAIVPRPGSRLSDEELGARLGVPLTGSVRVSRENKCIALVDRRDGDSRDGEMAVYIGQDMREGRRADEPADGRGPVPSLSGVEGYTVLDFAREGGLLVLGRVAECGSLSLERRGGRDVAVFKVRAVDGEACDDGELNPEVERALQSIESGTFVGRRCTVDEYIEHVRKVMKQPAMGN